MIFWSLDGILTAGVQSRRAVSPLAVGKRPPKYSTERTKKSCPCSISLFVLYKLVVSLLLCLLLGLLLFRRRRLLLLSATRTYGEASRRPCISFSGSRLGLTR